MYFREIHCVFGYPKSNCGISFRSMTEHQVIEIGLNLCCKFEGTIKLHLINSISHVCCFSPMLLHIVNQGRNCFYITINSLGHIAMREKPGTWRKFPSLNEYM